MNITLAFIKVAAVSAAALFLASCGSHQNLTQVKGLCFSNCSAQVAAKDVDVVPMDAKSSQSIDRVAELPGYYPFYVVTSPYHLALKNKYNLR